MPYPRLDIPQHAPAEVAALWLRFHELQLCQELDVAFVFKGAGFEAWCRIEAEKAYDRFLQLLEPLRSRFRIEVYPTRIPEDKKDPDKTEPPPSLSNNPELLNSLFGAVTGLKRMDGDLAPDRSFQGLSRDMLIKQRLLMYAEQVLDWNMSMRRLAGELPAFALYGFGPGTTPGLKARSAALCIQHAQEVARNSLKLEDNLKQAMPSESRRSRGDEDPPKPASARVPVLAAAEQVSRLGQAAGGQVYRFIYPKAHTVDLSDLKEPSLLQSLRGLRRATADFQQAVRRSAKP